MVGLFDSVIIALRSGFRPESGSDTAGITSGSSSASTSSSISTASGTSLSDDFEELTTNSVLQLVPLRFNSGSSDTWWSAPQFPKAHISICKLTNENAIDLDLVIKLGLSMIVLGYKRRNINLRLRT